MKAFITSIGETTKDLCIWSLERNGFEVVLIEDGSLLVDKLKTIYEMADDDFIRVDADVVPNNKCTPENIRNAMNFQKDAWWLQFRCFGWFAQDLIYGGIQFIKKEALPDLRSNVDKYKTYHRPETQLSRIASFYEPRRFESSEQVMGLHGFAASDIERVKQVKLSRGQDGYDFELSEKLMELVK